MTKLILTLLIVATDAAQGDAPEGSVPEPPPSLRIAFIGDDHGFRLGPELYHHLAGAGHSFAFKKEAGSTAKGWANGETLRHWLDAYGADAVIVCLGSVEGMRNDSARELREDFRSLVEKASGHGKRKIFWVAPPALRGIPHLDAVRSALESTEGIELILPEADYPQDETGRRLTKPAYRAWGLDIWLEIRRILAPSEP